MRGRGRKNDNLESGKFHIRLTTCESSVPESHTLKNNLCNHPEHPAHSVESLP
jgi:hypothetical protein